MHKLSIFPLNRHCAKPLLSVMATFGRFVERWIGGLEMCVAISKGII